MIDLKAMKRHFTQHGTNPQGDALDLYGEETHVLGQLLAQWDQTRLEEAPDEGTSIAPQKWDNGTLAKLLIEHAAARLAAQEDLAHALSQAGRHDLEHKLTETARAQRPLLARMDKLSRGVNPLSLAGDETFVNTLSDMRAVLQPALLSEDLGPEALGHALGEHRRQLHSAKYVRKHAPTSPGKGWYTKVPGLVRAQAAYDRARGFPWAESAPLASAKVAERYDREAS